jgi:hypothetical protein
MHAPPTLSSCTVYQVPGVTTQGMMEAYQVYEWVQVQVLVTYLVPGVYQVLKYVRCQVPVLYLLPGTSTPVPGTVLIIRDWKIVITDTGYQIPTVFYRPNTVILKNRGIRLPT